jgi:hypothetical protein
MKSLAYEVLRPLALISLTLAGWFGWIAWQQARHAEALAGASGRAVARLVEKTTFTSSGVRDGQFVEKGPTRYSLHYEFTHPETGETHQGRSSVGQEVWDAMTEGEHYEILFSKADPTITSLFKGQDFRDGARLAARLSSGFAVLGVLGLLFWRRCRPAVAPAG